MQSSRNVSIMTTALISIHDNSQHCKINICLIIWPATENIYTKIMVAVSILSNPRRQIHGPDYGENIHEDQAFDPLEHHNLKDKLISAKYMSMKTTANVLELPFSKQTTTTMFVVTFM